MPDIDTEELRRKAEALLAMDLSVGGIRPQDVLAVLDALDAKDREIERLRSERSQAELGWRQCKGDLAHSESERAALQGLLTETRNDLNALWHQASVLKAKARLVLAVRPDTQGLCTDFCAYCALAAALEASEADRGE